MIFDHIFYECRRPFRTKTLTENTFFNRIQDLKSHYEFEMKDSLLKLQKSKYYIWILLKDKDT